MTKLGKFLIDKRVIGPDQWTEAEAVAKKSGKKPEKALVDLGYA